MDVLETAKVELRDGLEQLRAPGLTSPASPSRLRHFFHGFMLPFVIRKRMLGDRVARRRYWRVGFWQAFLTVSLALFFVFEDGDWAEDDEPADLRAAAAELRQEAAELRNKGTRLPDEEELEEYAGEDEEGEEAQEAQEPQIPLPRPPGPFPAPPETVELERPAVKAIGELVEKTELTIEGADTESERAAAISRGLDEAARELAAKPGPPGTAEAIAKERTVDAIRRIAEQTRGAVEKAPTDEERRAVLARGVDRGFVPQCIEGVIQSRVRAGQ